MSYKIPLFQVQHAPKEDLCEKLCDVFDNGYWAEGKEVKDLEDKFKDKFKNENVFATNSCASGIMLALKQLGVGKDTSVIVTPMTCVATACPVSWLGAEIIWSDIDPVTGLMCPESIEERIQPNTKAILPVYWGGDVPNLDEINRIAQRHGIGVVEDAAQALGAIYPNGELVGNLSKNLSSDFVCFSFQAIKHMTTGDGGMVTCKDSNRGHSGKLSTWFGIDKHNFRLPSGEINWDLDIPDIGYKMHMNNITAAIGNVQFSYAWEKVIPRNVENGLKYDFLLKDIDGVEVIPRIGRSAYWVYTVCCERRDELLKYLEREGIQASRMHARIDIYTGFDIPKKFSLTGVDTWSKKNLCLPCGPWVRESDIEMIVEKIKAFYV